MPKKKRTRGKRGGWRTHLKELQRELLNAGSFDPSIYWREDAANATKPPKLDTTVDIADPTAATSKASTSEILATVAPSSRPKPPPSPPHVAPIRKPTRPIIITPKPRIIIKALLVKSDSWSYVNGDIPRPIVAGTGQAFSVSQAAANAWIVQDRKAKSDLILSISPEQLKHLRNCDTSKEVWDKLKSVYASQGPMRKATLLEQLLLQKMREGDDVRDYLSRFMSTVDKLQALNIDINGDLLSVMLLHSLPTNFDNFCCAIKSCDTT
ncbi:PREDICTED: uncharacterized protein LOC108762115 [Trachymyrmex cornetzi]|uniref:uncharacterized protein LOC108762115 n=1 Tax=Trachymyrmex cornetzi TaxID=471704 RepID=UPI00084F3BFF|nr:PREDICTED: uncharacterized protein LOC108762115 [Trachymyrmex cornetzi]